MSLRREVREVVAQGDLDALDALVEGEPAAVQYLLGGIYDADDERRAFCARGLARSARHHAELVGRFVRRLVWAMNDESGANALAAPGAVLAIAREDPALLLPVVPDLFRLSQDEGLAEGLREVLAIVAKAHPGELSARLGSVMTRELQNGRRAL